MTELVPVAELAGPVPVVVPLPPRFGAVLASVIFFLYLLAQTVASAAAVVVVTVILLLRSGGQMPSNASLLAASMQVATILAFGAGAIVVAGSMLLWTRHLRSEAGPRGLGWRRGTPRQQLLAALGGIAMAAAWLLAMKYLFPPISPKQYGPLAQMMSRGAWNHFTIAFVGIVLAPPVEELLFRGILLAGYVKRFGVVAGSIVTTLLFVMMHVGETIHYLPALAVVTMVGVILLMIRLRTDSIMVSTIFHTTYNAALMVVALWGASLLQ